MIILNSPSENKSLNDNIEKLLESVSDTTDLIIVEPKFDKRLSLLLKPSKKKAEVKEFLDLNEQEFTAMAGHGSQKPWRGAKNGRCKTT